MDESLILKLKAVVNKSNNQINFCIPRKKASKKLLDKVNSGKSIKFLFEED